MSTKQMGSKEPISAPNSPKPQPPPPPPKPIKGMTARPNRRYSPQLGQLEDRPMMDTIAPGGSHSAPAILESVTGPPKVIMASMDEDPGGNDPLPEPEPAPPPFPGADPPLGWPPIPKAGPVGPG